MTNKKRHCIEFDMSLIVEPPGWQRPQPTAKKAPVAMPRQTTARTKDNAPAGSSGKPTRKARAAAVKDLPSLQEAHQTKESGKERHLRAERTCATYSGHVRQGREWLQNLVVASGSSNWHHEEHQKTYGNPNFKDALERTPNECSDSALALYLSWKGFDQKCSQSTIDGIRVGFKWWWDGM